MAKLIMGYFFLIFLLACTPSFCQINLNFDYDALEEGNMFDEDLSHEVQRFKRASDIIDSPFLKFDIYIEIPPDILEEVRGILNNFTFPITLTIPGDPDANITSLEMTAVCTLLDNETQCACESGYLWNLNMCNTYESCSDSTRGSCDCIRNLPENGTCELMGDSTTTAEPGITQLPTFYIIDTTQDHFYNASLEYDIYIDIPADLLDEVNQILSGITIPFILSSSQDFNGSLTSLQLTTVCTVVDYGTECICEDGYMWDSQMCITYGRCFNATEEDCTCIREMPSNGTCEHLRVTTPSPATYLTTITHRVSKFINYEIYIETPDALLNALRETFKSLTVPVIWNTPSDITVNITFLEMTAVCALTDSNTECVCEEQHIWDSQTCNMYGSCLNTTSNNCSCVRDIPYNGTCEPYSPPPVSKFVSYEIYIETPDAVLNVLREIFKSLTVPFILNTTVDITASITFLEMTAVCALTDSSTECVCEEQHVWDRQTCNMYGSCLNTTSRNCSCVRDIPYNGTCEPYSPPPVSKFIKYEIYIETPDALLNALREIFKSLTVPFILNTSSDITANVTFLEMTAVCALTDSNTECVCEEQHVWDSQTCNMYGSCLNTTSNNCSCVRDIPYNGTCEPYSPPPVSKSINYEIYIETPDALLNGLREIFKNLTLPFILNTPSDITADITSLKMIAVCALTDSNTECFCEEQNVWDSQTCNMYGNCLNKTSNNCSCVTGIPYNGTCEPYSPLPVSKFIKYEIYIETPDALLNSLREIFRSLTLPVILNTPSDITANITFLEMTAVCALTDSNIECVCEENHIWDSQTCSMYGNCLNTTSNNCSCIRDIPYNGTCEPYSPPPGNYSSSTL
ncbi:uncharacterized protein LOC122794935 [Protopterus annectens]|uniref:uncharacterized protein LOC122794935 n=1 Tax=Protopterus annectens TaxID=7888 RepID=UPI001CFBDA14|nr:uncharacterized protein LOC122794935 [Protopterus annectens]